ncbi:K02A2.6-like [Cordylochernes scorpioides]|uniref:RNA-directed DNA polymerase n=1 Tax=Cordylochernes scorpioides TaxID=51811 RepID=A0ABY6L3G0_9ARAC|nr:K02A2.6-like [Cordylochernes scorpioides]
MQRDKKARRKPTLEGEPRRTLQSMDYLYEPYWRIKQVLEDLYPPPETPTHQEFYQLRCGPQGLQAYYSQKVRIGTQLNIDRKEMVNALTQGMPSYSRNLLLIATPSSPSEWFTLARRIYGIGGAPSRPGISFPTESPSPRQSGRRTSNPLRRLSEDVPHSQKRPEGSPSTAPTPCKHYQGPHWNNQCPQRSTLPGQRADHPRLSTPPRYFRDPRDSTTNRTLRKYESNYTITELECLAIIETVDRFKVYLAGNCFTIFTYHCALQWLKNIKNPTGRLFRWSLILSVYDYQVKYIKGTKQLEADLLSRNPFCGLLDATQLKMYQSELRDNPKYVKQISGLTTVTRRGVSKIVVPPSLRPTILREAHQKFNHPGISQLTRIISAQYFWSGMSIDIRAVVKNCNICQMSKTRRELSQHLDPYPLVTESRRLALQRTKERHKIDKIRFDKNHRSPDFEGLWKLVASVELIAACRLEIVSVLGRRWGTSHRVCAIHCVDLHILCVIFFVVVATMVRVVSGVNVIAQKDEACWMSPQRGSGELLSHSGIEGNEQADQYAKAAALSNLPLSYSTLSIKFFRARSKQYSFQLWNELYSTDHSRRNLRRIAASPTTLIAILPKIKFCGIAATILTGHGFVEADSSKISEDDPTCPHCHEKDQTVDHLLFGCPAYHLQRFQTATLLGIIIFTPEDLQKIPKKNQPGYIWFGTIENFDPSKPEKWTTYVERMIFFFLANGIEKITQKKAIFLTLIGPETYALARSLAAPKDLARVNYEEIVNILTGHFCPRPNLIVQRYHFNKHNQGNEPIATYIAELRRLSENCEFVDLDDRLRDRLVCGLKKESLVKRLLSEKDLTFEKAMDIALCDESASANASVLMETTPDVNILKKANKSEPFYFKSKQPEFNRIAKGLNKKIICIRCKGNHLPHVCKFRNSKCFKCGKIGHLQKACLTRVKKFEYLNRSNSDTYLHCLGTESLSNHFYIMVKLDNHDVAMLIDSGSAYSLLNKETFLKYWRVTQLEKSEVLLKTWSSSNVKILGKLFVKAKVTNGFKKLSILVADGLGPNILGRQWFEAFRLRINFLNHIETNPFSSEFEEVFKQEIDAYNGPLIHIDIPENAEPKFVKARTVPFALRELVDKKLKSLEEQGVIEPVKFTKWASPIVTVLKNDGTIRICHDYKSTVNLYSNPDKYPLPTIPQLLDRLRGGRVFTKLDMAQAYQQLKVDETSAEILAINTPRGLYKVKRLPFGLNSAVGTFQRFMDTLLSGIDGVAVYLDDVLISGRDCDDLKRKTEKVLLRFRESGLRMIIDHKGIHPSEEKLRAIKDARPPSNKRKLMSFLGLLNYYERFLNNKATVAEPLHRLLDSNSPLKWNKEHQRSFAEVKNLISSKSVLAHFNEDLPILVNCDASEYGVGAILSQIDHGVERPVVFASRTLNKTERRYAVIDKEALAVIFGVSEFSQYLLGRKFKILTDHKPLVGIFNPKKPIPQVLSPRMLRWCLTLAAYTYSIEYKPGKVNCNADALSRLPLDECPSVVPNPSEVFFIESEHAAINSSEVAKLTNKDPILSKVKFWAMNGWPERKVDDKFRDFVSKSSEISVHKDCLLWGSRVIIPERLRKDILNLLHDTHIGIVGTKALARGLCWWPKMDGDIERMISSCAVCLSCSHDPPKTDVYPWIWPSRPWSRLHIDHAGPFQGKLLLVVVDAYSKWIEAKIVSTTSTETTINCLKEIFATHGLPDVIVSDNGTSFTSELFRTFLKRNGVRHILCAPYHAASNGQVERAIQTLKNLLRKNSSGNWTTRLSRSLLSMRIAINSTTQKSPAQLLMNRNLKSLINKFHPEGVSEGRMRQENKFIRNWKPHRVVNEGQEVIARGYHGPRWLPGVVREKTGPVSIKVETNDGEIVNRHLDQVRSCEESEALPSTLSTPQVTPDFERPPAVQETDSSEGTPRPVFRRSLRIRKPPSFFES